MTQSNPLNDLIIKHQDRLDGFLSYQITNSPTNDFAEYALTQIEGDAIPNYATLLYKKYIEIEGVLLWADHYDPKQWSAWRSNSSVIDAANVLNHKHLQNEWDEKLVPVNGAVIAFFWNICLESQFPGRDARVIFDGGDIISLKQEKGS